MTTSIAKNPGTPSLEVVELELALQHQDLLITGFEGAVRRALERLGGSILFRMRMDGASGCDWIAAVALERGGAPKLAIVAQPIDGGSLRVEDAETSDLPVARLATAYANLIGQLKTLQ
ncbi:hypothetical protein [Chelativorans sp. Marseille-P2723]|uniref:hypothetical protein n=1 Tax=Chelativorans sp. Marseille-P2723 TaxID=2709133 RepID=UPI00156EB071|nr:hypothetical protein [Chelativorans sp. Marseille-P2723]